MMSLFNGCRTKLDFFTVCLVILPLLNGNQSFWIFQRTF